MAFTKGDGGGRYVPFHEDFRLYHSPGFKGISSFRHRRPSPEALEYRAVLPQYQDLNGNGYSKLSLTQDGDYRTLDVRDRPQSGSGSHNGGGAEK